MYLNDQLDNLEGGLNDVSAPLVSNPIRRNPRLTAINLTSALVGHLRPGQVGDLS